LKKGVLGGEYLGNCNDKSMAWLKKRLTSFFFNSGGGENRMSRLGRSRKNYWGVDTWEKGGKFLLPSGSQNSIQGKEDLSQQKGIDSPEARSVEYHRSGGGRTLRDKKAGLF